MLSVIVIVKNEAQNLRRCLSSAAFADQIIVLDSGSTDNTVSIAREFTQQVYITDWPGYGVQKQRALEKATGEWVLNLDADEEVSPELKHAIMLSMKSNDADAYRLPIRMVFYGKLLRYSSSPARHIRLFKREGAAYSSDLVHEKIILPNNARVQKLPFPLRHYSVQDVSHVLSKMNQYSSTSAKIHIDNKKQASLLRTMIGTGWMFFRCYLLQRGFLDGKAGFLFAIFKAQGTFYRGVKQLYPDV